MRRFTSATLGLLSAPDPEIMQAAAKEGCVLLTADADFGALLALSSLASPSVLLLRSAYHLRPAEQDELLAANLPSISGDLEKGRSRACPGTACAWTALESEPTSS